MLLLLWSDAARLIRVQAEVARRGVGRSRHRVKKIVDQASTRTRIRWWVGIFPLWRSDSKGCGFSQSTRFVWTEGRSDNLSFRIQSIQVPCGRALNLQQNCHYVCLLEWQYTWPSLVWDWRYIVNKEESSLSSFLPKVRYTGALLATMVTAVMSYPLPVIYSDVIQRNASPPIHTP